MYSETRTYKSFNGEDITEEFNFHLSKAEIVNMDMSTEGGLEQLLKRIIDAKNVPELIKYFQLLLDKSFGIKSPDGKKFVKTDAALADFKATNAYSDFYMQLITDEAYASKFVNAVLPKKD